MPQLRKIELSGSPRSMGQAFGEAFRNEIKHFAEIRMERLSQFVQMFQPDRSLTRDNILEVAGRLLAAHQQYQPAIWDEFSGIAASSGLPVEALLIMNGLTDIRDFVLLNGTPETDTHLGECTAFIVPKPCTTGETIVGQTWDMHADAIDFTVIVHRKPDEAPQTLCLTTVGCLCLVGVNSDGVAAGNSNLTPTDSQIGVNYLFTITHALQHNNALAAADAIVQTPRLSGHNFYVADRENAINLECTAAQHYRTDVENTPFVHANHYLSESFQRLDFRRDDNSVWRQDTLTRLFNDWNQPLTPETCWDHLGKVSQDCVPCEPAQQNTSHADSASTVATLVLCPAHRQIDICSGSAAAGTRQRMTL